MQIKDVVKCHKGWFGLYLIFRCLEAVVHSSTIQVDRFAEEMLLPFWPPLGKRDGGERCNLPIDEECYINVGFQVLQPIVGEGIADGSSELDFPCKEGKRWHLAKSQLLGCCWWIVEFKSGCLFARCEIGWQDSWRDYFLYAFCGVFISLPRIKLEFEGVLIIGILIMIYNPDGRIFSKSLIKAFEEISDA